MKNKIKSTVNDLDMVGETQPRNRLEQRSYEIYKMPKIVQNKLPEHIVYIKSEDISNGK